MAKVKKKTDSERLVQENAIRKVKELLGKLRATINGKVSGGIKEEWDGNKCSVSFSTGGFSISVTLTVEPSDMGLSSIVPLEAIYFKGRAESIAHRIKAEALTA